MSTAFSIAYPAERSMLARALLPLVQPRAYLRAIHFLLMFPLGLAYFVFFVTTFAFGGALIWTLVGPPVLLLALFVSLYIGDLEAWLVNVTTGEGIRRPPKVLEGVTSLRDKVWTRVIDPSTWTGLLYQVAQFPIGVAAFVTVVVGFSVSAALIGAPLIAWLASDPDDVATGPFELSLNDPLHAALLVPLGLLAWFVTMHVVTLLSSLHAMWARLMLGSRSRRRRDTGEPAAPDPAPGGPIALLPPGEPVPPPIAPATVAEPPPRSDGEHSSDDGVGVHPALSELTPREYEVLLLAVRGYSNADICEACYISEGTVKTHIRHILAKLELTDRTQLIVFAYEQGIVQPSRRPVAMSMAR
jgi:DNA-binding CsgD family transcriptional regulator